MVSSFWREKEREREREREREKEREERETDTNFSVDTSRNELPYQYNFEHYPTVVLCVGDR